MVWTVVSAWVKSTKVDPAAPKMAVLVGPAGDAGGVQLAGSFQSVDAPFQVAVWVWAGAALMQIAASAATTGRRTTAIRNDQSDPREPTPNPQRRSDHARRERLHNPISLA